MDINSAGATPGCIEAFIPRCLAFPTVVIRALLAPSLALLSPWVPCPQFPALWGYRVFWGFGGFGAFGVLKVFEMCSFLLTKTAFSMLLETSFF